MLRSQVLSPLMVGRAAELSALEALLAQAEAGAGAVALVGGDAGIGKTRLCRAFKDLAASRQFRVIEGRCTAGIAVLPYAPFLDALRFRLNRGEQEAAADVLAPVLTHVAPLFRDLLERDVTRSGPPAAVAVPFEPIFEVLNRLAGFGPVVLVLEDIHLADPTSRDLLLYIAQRISRLPLVLVATYRTDEIHPGHPVHRLVACLARDRLAVQIHLEPLSCDEVRSLLAALLSAPPDADFAAAVYDRTEGNPLFIEELLTVLLESCSEQLLNVHPTDLRDVPLPATLHEMVLERCAPLGEDALQVLGVASVFGRSFRFDMLSAVLEWSETRLLPVIEALVRRGIIREDTDGETESYSFRHAVVHEVHYESLIGRRRREFHRRAAAALAATAAGQPLQHTVLAHHYERGGDPVRARAHLVLAGDEAAALCAWQDAEAHYEAALAALERTDGDAAAEADILERMAEVTWWRNRMGRVRQYCEEALRLRRELGDRVGAARLLRRIATVEAFQRGNPSRASQALTEALDLVEPGDAGYVALLNDVGRLEVMQGRFSVAEPIFERSLVLGQECNVDTCETALSLVMLGRIAVHQGQVARGRARLELGRSLVADSELPAARGAEVLQIGIGAFDAAREHLAASEWVSEAIHFAESRGAWGELAVFRAYDAAVRRRAGNWAAARDQAEAAVATLRASERAELGSALRILGDVQRGRGELAAARALYDEAERHGAADAAVGRALVYAAESRWDDAAADLSAALARHTDEDRLFAMRVLPLLATACAHAGAPRDARAARDRLAALVADSYYRAGPASLALTDGIIAAASGDGAVAIPALQRAVEEWRRLELPWESAIASLLLAEQLIACGRADEAREVAGIAADLFEDMGAALDLSRAHAVLRQLGVRRRGRSSSTCECSADSPLHALTPREREVVACVARGHTNKQIARTLSLSPRTVANHVAAIFAKLGCRTRTEVAALALNAAVPEETPHAD
jgi:DNA-binding CsgD family transcriptional regulator/tetratricopeptide (TPR) repeat protein